MNTLEAIAKRASVRMYKSEQIPENALEKILKAGMSAPVGSGLYDSLHITVIQDWDLLNEISNAVTEMMVKITGKRMDKNFGAPTMVIVSSKPAMMSGLEYANVGCVLENMAIAATSLGIDNIIWGGSSVVAKEEPIRSKLNIPEGFSPVLCASFGYAVTEEPAKEHHISVNRI